MTKFKFVGFLFYRDVKSIDYTNVYINEVNTRYELLQQIGNATAEISQSQLMTCRITSHKTRLSVDASGSNFKHL